MTGSALYVGTVQHERLQPKPHLFRYPVYQVLLDLDEIAALSRAIPFFSRNRWNLTSFFDRDYMGREDAPVEDKLARWLAARGVEIRGKVFLLTSLRVLGYVFNPVSYYYIHDAGGRLECAVAEINNTFGETYAYLLQGGPAGGPVSARVSKAFHVSPFIAMDATYAWTLTVPGETLRVHIDESQGGTKFFEAFFAGRRRPLTARTLAAVLATHPHMPLRVISAIHWQALRLWLKRLPVFHKPEPPAGALRRSE